MDWILGIILFVVACGCFAFAVKIGEARATRRLRTELGDPARRLLFSTNRLTELLEAENTRLRVELEYDRGLWGFTMGDAEHYRAALSDIALCRIPNVPEGVTVPAEQFSGFARDRAQAALKSREAPPAPWTCAACGKLLNEGTQFVLITKANGRPGELYHYGCAPLPPQVAP